MHRACRLGTLCNQLGIRSSDRFIGRNFHWSKFPSYYSLCGFCQTSCWDRILAGFSWFVNVAALHTSGKHRVRKGEGDFLPLINRSMPTISVGKAKQIPSVGFSGVRLDIVDSMFCIPALRRAFLLSSGQVFLPQEDRRNPVRFGTSL